MGSAILKIIVVGIIVLIFALVVAIYLMRSKEQQKEKEQDNRINKAKELLEKDSAIEKKKEEEKDIKNNAATSPKIKPEPTVERKKAGDKEPEDRFTTKPTPSLNKKEMILECELVDERGKICFEGKYSKTNFPIVIGRKESVKEKSFDWKEKISIEIKPEKCDRDENGNFITFIGAECFGVFYENNQFRIEKIKINDPIFYIEREGEKREEKKECRFNDEITILLPDNIKQLERYMEGASHSIPKLNLKSCNYQRDLKENVESENSSYDSSYDDY